MWKSVQCAVQGRSHRKTNIPCQDKTYELNQNGVQVISLADGAGSALWSHYGAECVTEFICNELAEYFDMYFNEPDGAVVKKRLIQEVLKKLDKKARQLNCEVRDLASTLLVAAVKEDKYLIAHIGDGIIGYLKEEELKVASYPVNGEFANTTVFTTSKDASASMKLIKGRLNTITGFVLMSDGSETSLFKKKEKHIADAVKRIMKLTILCPIERVEKLLLHSFEKVICQATYDDCSISILMNDQKEFKGYYFLTFTEKCTLLQINEYSRTSKKQVRRYDEILRLLQDELTERSLSNTIRLKPKYLKKHLEKLLNLNFIEKNGKHYCTGIIME